MQRDRWGLHRDHWRFVQEPDRLWWKNIRDSGYGGVSWPLSYLLPDNFTALRDWADIPLLGHVWLRKHAGESVIHAYMTEQNQGEKNSFKKNWGFSRRVNPIPPPPPNPVWPCFKVLPPSSLCPWPCLSVANNLEFPTNFRIPPASHT